jgi:hypothetical protein
MRNLPNVWPDFMSRASIEERQAFAEAVENLDYRYTQFGRALREARSRIGCSLSARWKLRQLERQVENLISPENLLPAKTPEADLVPVSIRAQLVTQNVNKIAEELRQAPACVKAFAAACAALAAVKAIKDSETPLGILVPKPRQKSYSLEETVRQQAAMEKILAEQKQTSPQPARQSRMTLVL